MNVRMQWAVVGAVGMMCGALLTAQHWQLQRLRSDADALRADGYDGPVMVWKPEGAIKELLPA